jgi:hypothetical protein
MGPGLLVRLRKLECNYRGSIRLGEVLGLMVRECWGSNPRTNALKGLFRSLQGVAIVCIGIFKSFIYSYILIGQRKRRCMELQGIQEKVSQKYHFGMYAETVASFHSRKARGCRGSVECHQNPKK